MNVIKSFESNCEIQSKKKTETTIRTEYIVLHCDIHSYLSINLHWLKNPNGNWIYCVKYRLKTAHTTPSNNGFFDLKVVLIQTLNELRRKNEKNCGQKSLERGFQ